VRSTLWEVNIVFKKLVCIVMASALLVMLQPIAAQEGLWKAYLFNATSGELHQVNADGSQASYDLGIDTADGSYTGGSDLTFSADGLHAAWCRMIYSGDTQAAISARLTVRDLVTGVNTLELPLQALQGCRTGEAAFNEDGSLVAVATVNSFGDPATAGVPAWAYQVIEVGTGVVVASLIPDALSIAGLEWINNPVMLLTQRFSGDEVIFTVARWASEGTYDGAWLWNFREGSVTAMPYWGASGVDYLPSSGEYAVSALDPNRPVGEPLGPVPIYNVAQVVTVAETRPVFAGGTDWLVLDQVFVNDGRSLAMLLLSTFDPNNPNAMSRTRWALLERDGGVQDLFISELYSDLRAIPGGYMLFTQDALPAAGTGATSYSLRLGAGDAMQTIWQSPPAVEYQAWELVWTTPYTPASDLPPFTAIP
jgi:hypothetical protein